MLKATINSTMITREVIKKTGGKEAANDKRHLRGQISRFPFEKDAKRGGRRNLSF